MKNTNIRFCRNTMKAIIWLIIILLVSAGMSFSETIAYQYDNNGRLLKADYGSGKTISYTYDANGNLLERVVSDSPVPPPPGPSVDPSPSIYANFIGTPTSGQAPLTVQFTDQSVGSFTAWSWDFGDGQTSTEKNPSHTYTTPGYYSVKLTSSGAGISDSLTRGNYIVVSEPSDIPTAAFTATPTTGPALLTVQFTNQSTGQISEYYWYFGDGGTSREIDPSYIYVNAGTYTVDLTVVGEQGRDNISKTNLITVNPPSGMPASAFTATPVSGTAPLTVQFLNQSKGEISSWLWNFGDGQTSTDINPKHIYSTPGTFTVSLKSIGSKSSNTVTKTDYIHVAQPPAPPVAAFTTSTISGTAPLTVQFTDQSTGEITSWVWDFGDGGISDLQNPSNTYTVAGTYTVTLTVSGNMGSDNAQTSIQIAEPVHADFAGSPASGFWPLRVNFTAECTGEVDTYYWDFGDGKTSQEKNPKHIYWRPGIYPVTLTVTGTGGTDSETKPDYITVRRYLDFLGIRD